jgi:hypothetical protein
MKAHASHFKTAAMKVDPCVNFEFATLQFLFSAAIKCGKGWRDGAGRWRRCR